MSRLSAHRVQLLNAVIKHATCVMPLLVPVVQGHAMALNIKGLSSLQVKGVIHIDIVPHRHRVDDMSMWIKDPDYVRGTCRAPAPTKKHSRD